MHPLDVPGHGGDPQGRQPAAGGRLLRKNVSQLPPDIVVRRGQRPLDYRLADGCHQDAVLRQAFERRRTFKMRSRDRHIEQDAGVIADLNRAQRGNEDIFVKPSPTTVEHLCFGRAKAVDHVSVTPKAYGITRNNLAIWQRREGYGCIVDRAQ
jgi:hypothetical protein